MSSQGRHPDTRTFHRHEDPLLHRRDEPQRDEIDPTFRSYLTTRRDSLYMEIAMIERLLGMERPPARRQRLTP